MLPQPRPSNPGSNLTLTLLKWANPSQGFHQINILLQIALFSPCRVSPTLMRFFPMRCWIGEVIARLVLCEGIWCRIRVTEGEARDEPLMSGGDNQGEGRRKRGIGNWELHRFWGKGIEGWYCCRSVEYGFVSLEVLDLLVTKRVTQCSSSLETCKPVVLVSLHSQIHLDQAMPGLRPSARWCVF